MLPISDTNSIMAVTTHLAESVCQNNLSIRYKVYFGMDGTSVQRIPALRML